MVAPDPMEEDAHYETIRYCVGPTFSLSVTTAANVLKPSLPLSHPPARRTSKFASKRSVELHIRRRYENVSTSHTPPTMIVLLRNMRQHFIDSKLNVLSGSRIKKSSQGPFPIACSSLERQISYELSDILTSQVPTNSLYLEKSSTNC